MKTHHYSNDGGRRLWRVLRLRRRKVHDSCLRHGVIRVWNVVELVAGQSMAWLPECLEQRRTRRWAIYGLATRVSGTASNSSLGNPWPGYPSVWNSVELVAGQSMAWLPECLEQRRTRRWAIHGLAT